MAKLLETVNRDARWGCITYGAAFIGTAASECCIKTQKTGISIFVNASFFLTMYPFYFAFGKK